MTITAVTGQAAGKGEGLAWRASAADGTGLGTASLRLHRGEGQRHLATLDLRVPPGARGRGTGGRLLDAALDAARGGGRRSVLAQAEPGSPGERFLHGRGFRPVLRLTFARLALPLGGARLAELTRTARAAHDGYRLMSWAGTVPDRLAGTFAAARRAMDDMPVGESGRGPARWDAERVRAAARAVASRGDLLHTVAAVTDEGTAPVVVGFTELVVPGHGATPDGTGVAGHDRGGGSREGLHYGTGVLPEHRGRGLGLWMKAESVRHAAARRPCPSGLLTDTADDNLPMRRSTTRSATGPRTTVSSTGSTWTPNRRNPARGQLSVRYIRSVSLVRKPSRS